MDREPRVNRRIRAREVRLIGESGEQLGIIPLSQALQIATEHDLDLVEVAPTATPPVCRLLDYGRFKYDQAKKKREARKRQKVSVLREVRLRPKINEHDMEIKIRRAKKFLDEGDKVKFSVFFRGREITHPEIGTQLLKKVSTSLQEIAGVERPPIMEGRSLTLILTPARAKQPPKKEP